MYRLAITFCALLLLPAAALAGGRYYVNSLWSHMNEAKDPALTREYIKVTKSHGFNALSIEVHWNTARPDGSYDFEQFDRVAQAALDSNLAVFVRVNTSCTWGLKPYWLKPEHLGYTTSGEPFVRKDVDNSGIPSISNREVLDRMVHFYEAVGRHCREKFGSGKVVCFSAAITLFGESEYWEQIDYSPSARAEFVPWAKKEYRTLADLNKKWGTQHKSWDEVNLLDAHPTARELFFESRLERFFSLVSTALRKGDPKAKFGMQTGCIWDNPWRRTMNCARFFEHCDWLFVADAPIYPHPWSCDYLRGLSQGKVRVANEIDGPYLEMLTNERVLRQGVETWDHGVDTLFICNWNLGNLNDPKFAALDDLGKLARQPAKVIEADRAIYISVWDLIDRGWEALGQYQRFYDSLPDKDKRPVDIINDGVFDRDPKVLRRYKEVYLPANKRIPEPSRKALLTVKDRLRITDPSSAGSLDEYNRPTKPLSEAMR